MGLTVSRQTAKKSSKSSYQLAVKRFQGLSNLGISAARLRLLALKESFYLVQSVSLFPNIPTLRPFSLICV